MAFQPHPNLLSTTVVTPPSPVASGTSMTVSTTWATKVAALSLPVMAIVSPDFTEPDDSNSEIVQITAANGGTGLLTIVRARESTSARNIAAGDRVRIGLTAKSLTDIETAAMAGDLSGTFPDPTIGTNKVTNAKFRQSAGLSVVGRSASSTGDVADITAANASDVLRYNGSTLGFGPVGWTNERLAKTADYTVANGDKGKTLALGGTAYFTLTLNAASGYDANFAIRVVNEDTGRAKRISPNGLTSFLLYPGQDCMVFAQNNVWKATNPGRWRLTGAVTVYVDGTNGNANNDGLASGSGNALATLQQAANVVMNALDMQGQAVTISVADGTYTAGVVFASQFTGQGIGSVSLVGNTGTPANALISVTSGTCISASGGARVNVSGFKLSTTTSGHCALASNPGTSITFNGAMEFGACAGKHMYAFGGASISVTANYTINGAAQHHWIADGIGSFLSSPSRTITISGTPAFSSQFAQAFHLASMVVPACTFSGAATGTRYSAQQNAVIRTDGGGATYLPGDAAGSTATGGQYT